MYISLKIINLKEKQLEHLRSLGFNPNLNMIVRLQYLLNLSLYIIYLFIFHSSNKLSEVGKHIIIQFNSLYKEDGG